ncbi:MAG: hypothetical protein U0U25_05635 [Flavobacteriales bacterium]
MDERLSFGEFLGVFRRHPRLFIGAAIAAVVLSAGLSHPAIIKPRYRSMAIVYPVNLNSYSIETRSDQLLQLFESNSVRDSVIAKYRLAEHWRVDTAAPTGRFILYNLYRERVEIGKTRYESVQLEVTDEDPVMARDMVVTILDQVNLLARRLQREKSAEVLAIAERELAIEQRKMDSVETRLAALRRETGLLNYDAQTEEVTRGYLRMQSGGASAAARDEARALLKALGEKGGEFRQLTDLGNIFRGNYAARLNELEKVRTDLSKELTYTNVVVYPEVPDKKVYPVRWLIVLVSTASTLFLCFLLALWRERNQG